MTSNREIIDQWRLEDEIEERKNKAAKEKMLNSYCCICRKKVEDISDFTMGTSYCNKWYCIQHVNILYRRLGVKNYSEFLDKAGYR